MAIRIASLYIPVNAFVVILLQGDIRNDCAILVKKKTGGELNVAISMSQICGWAITV
ncbi:MAG TPA: hypothetical protein VMW36_06215 [Patescibacteria group bacterium]|nr:hypothetical protein [Patescibacteria group bacterium]